MAELVTDLVVRHHGCAPGPGTTTLLLLHGLTDSGEGWSDAVARWGQRYAVVAVDQRGHGGSPRFTADQLAGPPGEVMVEDALTLLDQLDRPVVVGHSLGGAVALAAAVRRPDRVRALVLEDPAPLGPDEPQRRPDVGAEYAASLAPSRAASSEEELLAVRRAAHPHWPESELLPTGRAEQQMDLDYLRHGDWKPAASWPELFAQVAVPTLVLSGDATGGDICIDDEIERGLAAIGNDRVRLLRIPGAGHCVRRDRPEEYDAAVEEFLRSV